MEALSARHTVYAIDMVGFGGSVSDAPEITIATQAAAVLALLDAESVPWADLIGNSVGGWVATTFAAAYPDRVRRLALVDAAGFKAMFEGPSPVNFYPDNVADMQKLLRFVRHVAAAQSLAAAGRALAELKASLDAAAAERVFAGMFASERLEDVADKISVPTLKMACALCHGSAVLRYAKTSGGALLAKGKTVTGFANVEEDFADNVVWDMNALPRGQHVMPWRIEDELRALGANYVQAGLWRGFAIRDGNLLTGQQNFSGFETAEALVRALGE
jgi:hypothetical protein